MEGQPNTSQVVRNTKNKQRVYAGIAALVFVVLIAGIFELTAIRSSSATRVAAVRITSSGFQPATLTVKAGTKITWTNDDKGLHQVASNPFPKDNGLPGLKSVILNNDQSYTYVANTNGTFGYHDQLTPTINGTIVVKK